MFQQFLDAANYWFGYSDDSNIGSYDPASECFMVVVGDLVDGTGVAGAGGGEDPQNLGVSAPQNPGPNAPPTSPARAPTSMRSWLKRASSRLSSKRNTAQCDCYAPPLLERPPHAANACTS
jgi:hypothetical protein